jgi:hypothetical protein
MTETLTTTMTDAELLDGFERATLAGLSHRDHVRVAWLYLGREPLESALPRFCADLRRFAIAAGAPGLYHATITWAYLALVHERRQGRLEGESFDTFIEANADLLSRKPSVLERYYRAETLASDEARAAFVLPDRLAP